MKIAVISGSQRQNSNTHKIANLVESELRTGGHEPIMIDLAGHPLPLWDDSAWEQGSNLSRLWQPYAALLGSAEAVVVLSPEWHGMVPSALKNFFLFCTARELGHKPGLIITVSTGLGGSYPVHELRTSSYKNTRLCYIPEQLIFRQVEAFLADYTSEALPSTPILKQRLRYSLTLLAQYGAALTQVRESGVVDHKQFPNGM